MKAVRPVLDFLKSGGVEYVFGIPAGSVNAFFDELFDMPDIKPIVTKHEGAASYMAATYAKYTNSLGVCIGSSGPGGTNLISGAANAMREHLPVLFLTGAVPVSTEGLNASQELDAEPVFRSVTKYSVTVKDGQSLISEVAKAVKIALTGVPGPVHVAMPIDVQLKSISQPKLPEFPKREPLIPNDSIIKEAALKLHESDGGYIFIGQGIRGSQDLLIELAEILDWKIITTPQAKGSIPSEHPLNLGVFGFAGHDSASEHMNNGKVQTLLVIGSSLGETATSNYNMNLTKNRFVIQLDFDESVFNRKYITDIPILGDINLALGELIQVLKQLGKKRKYYHPKPKEQLLTDGLDYNTQNVLYKLQDYLPSTTRYTIDIGEFMSYVINHMNVLETDTFDINVHFGAMGSGISAAIGSKIADPFRPVVCITGDGCFFMHGMELLTAKEYNLPILFVVINNARLGMVYHGHSLQYNRSHPRFEQNPVSISQMAEAMGIPNARVGHLEELNLDVLGSLKSDNGPALLEIALVDNNVPPMGDRVKFLSSFGK